MVLSLRIIAEKYRKHGESLPERLRQSEKQQKRMMNRLLLCNVIAQLDPVGTAFNRLVEQQKQLNEAKARECLFS